MLLLRVSVDLGAFPQSSNITGTSPSDCLVSHSGHSLGVGVLPLCRGAIGVFYSPSRLDKDMNWMIWVLTYIYIERERGGMREKERCDMIFFLNEFSDASYITQIWWRCPWCNGYRCRKWTRRHEFKSWTRLIAFHIVLITLGKVWIQLFSLQLWVNSRTDWVLLPWWGS